jgi:polyisoprenoid-binding protein YceI
MNKRLCILALVAICAASNAPARAADDYNVDVVHSSMTFKIQHLGLAFVHGRFNEFSGTLSINPDAAKCSFTMNVKVETIDTANAKRDEHLRTAEYFDVKKYPEITFKSTAVKAGKDGYEVTGDFSMRGVTKSITFTLTGGKKAEIKGQQRIGFSTDLMIKRSDYGMKAGIPAIGDEVYISISYEGLKK